MVIANATPYRQYFHQVLSYAGHPSDVTDLLTSY